MHQRSPHLGMSRRHSAAGPGPRLGRGFVNDVLEIAEDKQVKAADYLEEFVTMRYWLSADTFDRQVVNTRLALYTVGDERWQDADQEVLHP